MSKAKTIYRYSFVGQALKETLEELSEKMELNNELKEELLIKFDEVNLQTSKPKRRLRLDNSSDQFQYYLKPVQ